MRRIFPCVGITIGYIYCCIAWAQVWPNSGWRHIAPDQVQMDETRLREVANYALTGGGAGMISRGGYVVYSWGDQTTRFDLKSTTKSIGGTALGLALADNMLLLTDTAQQHLPGFGLPPASNSSTGWLDDIQIINLATHTAGFPKKGGYGSLFFAPGSHWSYSDEGVNWLADVLTWIYREDLNSLLSRRIFGRLGITSTDLVWRSNAYREDTLGGVKRREFGSGITANVDAMGRIGYLYLREGNWEGEQLIPSSFVSDVRLPHPAFTSLPALNRPEDPNASRHYGLLWWTNADGTLPGVPADAYWSWGLWDSLIVVIPSLDLVAVRAGPKGFEGSTSNGNYAQLQSFIGPIAQSISGLTVPSFVGSTLTESKAAITASGLTLGTVSRQADNSVPEGTVVGQIPAQGEQVNGGSPVALTVSNGGGPARSGLPTLQIEAPGIDSWVSGKIAIRGTAADESGITEITIAIDGAVTYSSVADSVSYRWVTTGYSNGAHVVDLTAKAADGGITTVSRRVTVDNYVGSDAIPYPYSTDIVGIEIAARSSMVSTAPGNDNWPMTWADDGDLYTAYGDGTGFRNEVERRLSLGFAKVTGSPPRITGINIRSPSGERFGNGNRGEKASGMLMVDGVLYMWARNANNAGQQCQLAWSTDHAATWNWSAWRFDEFGYCTFLNFGQNYGAARDNYVYMYTPDSPSGYAEADRIVLTRVPRSQILEKTAYEFYAGLDSAGNPIWSPIIGNRAPVYEFPGGANRLDVVYDPGLGRYLMTMRAQGLASSANPRHFSIYDAPQPWGPWTTIYYTNTFYGQPMTTATNVPSDWGEAQRLPSKWIDADGTALQLLCSCSDTLSVVPVQLFPQ